MRTTTAAIATMSAAALLMPTIYLAHAEERPQITWVSCPAQTNVPGARCGEIQVPMDYADPDGKTITVGFVEIPANDGTAENGHIFFNPGGPGGSVYDMFTQEIFSTIPAALKNEFAWVGVQPRGLLGSTPLQCTNPESLDPPTTITGGGRVVRQSCEDNQPGYTRTITTENTARDWEEVRKALALEKVDVYGISYGTQLSSVYATLFPDRVDKIVLDSGYGNKDNAILQVPALIAVAHEFFDWAAARNDILGLGATAREVYDRWAAQVEAESGTNPTLPPPDTPWNDLGKQWENAVKQLASGGQVNQMNSPFMQTSMTMLSTPTQWGTLAALIGGKVTTEELLAQAPSQEESAKQMTIQFAVMSCNEFEAPPQPELAPAAIAGVFTGDPFATNYLDGSGLWCLGAPLVTDYPDISGAKLTTRPLQIQGLRDPLTPYEPSHTMREAMGSHLLTVDSATHGHIGRNPVVDDAIVEYLRTGHTNVTWAPQEPIEVQPQT